MSKGIDIAIAADTRSAMSAIQRGLIDPLEDVSEVLEKIGDQRDTDKLERGMRDAQRRTDDAKDEIRDLRDELNRAGRAGKTAGDDIQDGMRRAEKGTEDFKSEANSTAREAAASFDGSAESIGDAFQEVAANAFSGFGPAGAVAGLAAAAGIGLATAGFTAVDEARKASEERVSGWADAFLESGGRALSAGVLIAKGMEILTDPTKFAEAESKAKEWGVSVETAIAALSGNRGAIQDVKLAVGELGDAYDEAAKKAPAIGADGTVNTQLYEQEKAYRAAAGSLSQLTGEMERGQQRADLMTRIYVDTINATAGVTKQVDELGNELYTLPDQTQILIDAQTGQATQNVDKFKGDLETVPKEAVVKVRVDSSEYDNWTPKQKVAWVDVQGGIARNGRQLLQ